MRFPKIDDVAAELRSINKSYDADEDGIDVRLQVYPDGDWAVRWGLSDYDQDHRGYWGSSSVPGSNRRFDSKDVARDLIDQAKEEHAMGDEGEELDEAPPAREAAVRASSAKRKFHIGQDVAMISNPTLMGHVVGFDPDGSVMVRWHGGRTATGVNPDNLRVLPRGYAETSVRAPHGGQRKLGFHAEARRSERHPSHGTWAEWRRDVEETLRGFGVRSPGQAFDRYEEEMRQRYRNRERPTEAAYAIQGHLEVDGASELREGHGGYTHKQDATYATVDNVFLNGRKIGRINGPLGGKQGEYYAWSLSSVSSTEHPPFGMSGASGRARSLQAAFNEIVRADKTRKARGRQ